MKNFTTRVKSANPDFATVFLSLCLALLAFLLLLEQPICNMGTVHFGQIVGQSIAAKITKEQRLPDFKRLALQQNLSWCFLSAKRTHKISGELGLFPAKTTPSERTRLLTLNGNAYWDCVTIPDRGDPVHVGLAAPRLLITRLVDPASDYAALWIWVSLGLVVTLAYIISDQLYTKPIKRSLRLINAAIKTHRGALKDLPETLRIKLAVSEIKELTEAVAALSKFYETQYQETVLETQTKPTRASAKKGEGEPAIFAQAPSSRPGVGKSILAKQSTAAWDDAFLPEPEAEPSGSLATFPKDVIERLAQELEDENVLLAYASIEGETKFKILESTVRSEADKVLLESFIGKSQATMESVLARESVHISERALAQYGLTDLKSRMQISKVIFFEVNKTPGHWEGLCLAVVGSKTQISGDLKFLHRFAAKQKQLRAVLHDQAGKDRSRWLDSTTHLPNTHYLEEKLSELFKPRTAQSGNTDPFSVITIALGYSPSSARDRASNNQMAGLAQMLDRVGHLSDPLENPSAYGRYALHVSSNLFVLVDGWADGVESKKLADKLVQALMTDRLSGEKDCLPLCHIGVASYPENGDSLEEVFYASRVAGQYGQSFGQPNSVFVARDLPLTGVLLEETAEEMKGDLTVLSSPVLMQSIRSSARTGELQVWSSNDGRTLRVLWERGKPIQARFGNLSGHVAMIEFLVTCTRGEYAFHDRNLGGFTHILKENLSFDKILLDAALASDYRDAAQKSIAPTDTILEADQSVAGLVDGAQRLEMTEIEFELAKLLLATATSARTVAVLKDKLAETPDYRFWRVLHLLSKAGYISLGKSVPSLKME